jgi:hypothetical protein
MSLFNISSGFLFSIFALLLLLGSLVVGYPKKPSQLPFVEVLFSEAL